MLFTDVTFLIFAVSQNGTISQSRPNIELSFLPADRHTRGIVTAHFIICIKICAGVAYWLKQVACLFLEIWLLAPTARIPTKQANIFDL